MVDLDKPLTPMFTSLACMSFSLVDFQRVRLGFVFICVQSKPLRHTHSHLCKWHCVAMPISSVRAHLDKLKERDSERERIVQLRERQRQDRVSAEQRMGQQQFLKHLHHEEL